MALDKQTTLQQRETLLLDGPSGNCPQGGGESSDANSVTLGSEEAHDLLRLALNDSDLVRMA